MAIVQRSVNLLDLGLLDDLAELATPHPADNLVDDLGTLHAFDHQRQLHRRRL